jgi:hypothetical protein
MCSPHYGQYQREACNYVRCITIIEYLYGGLVDGEPFGSFWEDYMGWTEAIFEKVGKGYTKELKRVLRNKGVATGRANKSVIPTLQDLLAQAQDSPPEWEIRAEAIQKAMKALRKIAAERAATEALNIRNEPPTEDILELPLQSEVMVWREKKGWQGPYKVIPTEGYEVTVNMVNGPTTFRTTVVKRYYRNEDTENGNLAADTMTNHQTPAAEPIVRLPRRRGRPAGSKNKVNVYAQCLTKKEEDDYAQAIKLRQDGVINTSGAHPFEASDQKEVDDLVGRGVFSFELFDPQEHGADRIFKVWMVLEINGKTMVPYEKS